MSPEVAHAKDALWQLRGKVNNRTAKALRLLTDAQIAHGRGKRAVVSDLIQRAIDTIASLPE